MLWYKQINKNKNKNHLFWQQWSGVTRRAVNTVLSIRRRGIHRHLILNQNKFPVTLHPGQSITWVGSHSGESVMFKFPHPGCQGGAWCYPGSWFKRQRDGNGNFWNCRDPEVPPSCFPESEAPWASWGEKDLEARGTFWQPKILVATTIGLWPSVTLPNVTQRSLGSIMGHT